MAQSQMNLTASITIDQSKLDADIRLARAKMQQLSKEANAAARAAVAPGGDRAAFDAASAAASQQDRVLQGLTRQKKELLATTNQLTAAHIKEAGGFKEATRSILEFGRAAGVTTVKVKDLRLGIAGLVSAEVIKAITDSIDKITTLVDVSKGIGVDTRTIQGFGRALEEAGGKAEDATGGLEKLFGNFTKERADLIKLYWDSFRAGVPVAESKLSAFGKTMNDLNIDITRFANNAQGKAQFLQAFSQRLIELNKSGRPELMERADIASQERTGKSFAQLEPSYAAAAAGDVAKLATVTKEAEAAAKSYNIAINEIKTTWDELVTATLQWVIPDILPGLKATKVELQHIAYWVKYVTGLLGDIGTEFMSGLPQDFSSDSGNIKLATGGYVRGPGSATSDSIAARLSNGEFVVNAASVRRLGIGAMQAINSFAAGGLVGTPPIRFAEGGLVSAASSSGRPVHLHLGGSSFALSGSSGVVDALVSHAHGQQMRSAGVKPSWFAGRPSGR